jgi:predicted RNA-binding Zn-ribbon protein involved in translation (DUF1610 family)
MESSDQRAFVCPVCGGQIELSPETREAVIQSGCPFCSSPVERQAAFS